VRYRYWDSCTFLGWLKQEEDKVDECRNAVRAAEKGDIKLVTSAFTLTEVLKLKGADPIPPGDAEKVRGFFANEYIVVHDVDRAIAEMAQELVWFHNVKPKDSVHLATALTTGPLVGIEQFDTFDNGLISLSGKLGEPALKIGRPDLPGTLPV
jgi:predicted nucleic acid-binding protein